MSNDITPCRSKWDGTMTDRERFNAQMHYQPVDRCFNMEFGYWEENFDLWPIFREHGIHSNSAAHRLFNFDRIEMTGGNTWMLPPFEEQVIEVKGDTKIIINADGLLAEVPVDGHGTIPHFLKSSIETPDDWQRIKEERLNVASQGRKLDVEAIKARHPDDREYPLGIDCGSMIGRIRDLLTFEGLAFACFDYPDMVEDMVETACCISENVLDQLLPHLTFDYACGWEDICYKSGPIVSLDFFTQVVKPRYQRLGDKLHAAGIDLWYTDCDGDVRALIPGFLEAGINCLFPYEVNCCVHPGELLDQYAGQLRIMGGFNKLEMRKGKQAIRAYMDSLVPYVERGGYIPFCDHRCPPDVDPADYLYYLDLKEQMFGIPAGVA